jgi:hypothetical protein
MNGLKKIIFLQLFFTIHYIIWNRDVDTNNSRHHYSMVPNEYAYNLLSGGTLHFNQYVFFLNVI